jgi:hypothetical protein
VLKGARASSLARWVRVRVRVRVRDRVRLRLRLRLRVRVRVGFGCGVGVGVRLTLDRALNLTCSAVRVGLVEARRRALCTWVRVRARVRVWG